jgi:hypothetical protein
VDQLAELADKLTRNEIVSSNEFRAIIGLPPAKDKKADQLRNSNMPEKDLGIQPAQPPIRVPSTRVPPPQIEP